MLLLIFLFLSQQAHAAQKPLTPASLSDKIRIKTEVFLTSSDGKSLRFIEGGWSESRSSTTENNIHTVINAQVEDRPKIFVESTLTMRPDLQMQFEIVQWEKVESSPIHAQKFVHELKRTIVPVIDFGSVQFSIPVTQSEKYVVRMMPEIDRSPAPEVFSYLPMSLSDAIITDNSGKLWAEGGSVEGGVVRVSGRYGSLYLSFAPFSEAREMGFARDQIIELRIADKKTLRIRSSKAIIGAGYAPKVFARFLPDLVMPYGGGGSMAKEQVDGNIKQLEKDLAVK